MNSQKQKQTTPVVIGVPHFLQTNNQNEQKDKKMKVEGEGKRCFLHELHDDLVISKIWGLIPALNLFPSVDSINTYKTLSEHWNALASSDLFAKQHYNSRNRSLFVIDNDHGALKSSHTILENFFDAPNPLAETFSTFPLQVPNAEFGKVSYRRPTVGNSCNGLLSLYNPRRRGAVFLFNPLTGECLRTPATVDSCKLWYVTVALGSNENNEELKFLRISVGQFVGPALIEVHTVGSQIWRIVKGSENIRSVNAHPIISLKGKLYLLVEYQGEPMRQMHLVEFNLETEVFQNVSWPLNEESNELSFESSRVSIANIDDYLCAVTCAWENDAVPVLRSWILRDMKWAELFTLILPNGFLRSRTCPNVFRVPRTTNSYIVHQPNNAELLIYNDIAIGFRRFRLHAPEGVRGYCLFDHTPNLMQLKNVVNLGRETDAENAVVSRCEQGNPHRVSLMELQ